MSLPTAPKDINDHPTKGSVIDPVNKNAKDADVDRKLRLYGIIQAFRLGRLPSNAQIDQTLKYVLNHAPIHVDRLSQNGQKLVKDIQDIIETARLMVQEKNADELFQQFMWHTRAVDKEEVRGAAVVATNKDGLPVDKEKVDNDSELAIQHLRTLLSLILTNSEVRKLLSDFSLIGRDLLSRTLHTAGEMAAPDSEALANVDATGPQDEFITEGGRRAGPGETPVLEARVPGTGGDVRVKQHPREGEAKVKGADGRERGVGEIGDVLRGEAGRAGQVGQGTLSGDNNDGGRGVDAVKAGLGSVDREKLGSEARGVLGTERVEKGKENARDVRDDVNARGELEAREREAGAVGEEEEVEVERKKGGIWGRVKGVRDTLTDRVPQEHKDRVERGKRFLTEEYFPVERRDQFIFRGKKVIIECQKHEDYQDSLRWLLGSIEEYAKHGKAIAGQGREGAKGVSDNRALQDAITEIRTLLERFANGKSMDIIIDAFNVLADDAKRDEALREWFKSVDTYIRKVLLDPGYVLEPDCNNQAKKLRESGRQFYDDKYKSHFDGLFDSVGQWFKAMGEDPINARFGEDWARLTRDLLFDSEGSLKFKKDLWNDIRKVILPELVDKVGYIPIPRIEYTDDNLDLVVENLTLSGRNLFPNLISLEAHNYVKFSPYTQIHDEAHHRFTLTFGQIQADMRDVAFYFHKKTGMPRMKDSGLADVVMGGEGVTATVVLVSAPGKDRSSVFKVQTVNVKVDSLRFSIRDSKHDLLYKTLKPLATGLVKRQIQKAIADAIETGLEYVDGQLVGVRDRMEVAKRTEGERRMDVLQDMFKSKKEETVTRTTSVTSSASSSQFKVVSNKRNSILASAGHPAGWVNRTAEKDDLASKGEGWRSEAFTIIKV